MKCMKINDIVDYMLSLDLTDFIEEEILVKNKYCIYSSIIRLTYDRTMIRCVPNQALSGGKAIYDGRTIYAPIESNDRTQPIIYYAGQTDRINFLQPNEANIPQAMDVVSAGDTYTMRGNEIEDSTAWTTLEVMDE